MTNYFNWAVIGTSLTMVWGYFSGFLSRLRSFFIINARLQDFARDAFVHMLHCDFKRSRFGDKRMVGTIMPIKPLNKSQIIIFEDLPQQPLIFWKGWRPILVGSVPYSGVSPTEMLPGQASITFIRWTFDLDVLMNRASDLLNAKNDCADKSNKRFCVTRLHGSPKGSLSRGGQTDNTVESPRSSNKSISEMRSYRLLKYTHEELGLPSPPNPIAGYAFPDNVQELMGEIKRWLESREWFLSKRIPWTLGILMLSKPGCGKSSLCRVIGQTFDLPIFSLDLSSMNNDELYNKWEITKTSSPCICLIEDIDATFHGRENVINPKEGVTFDCLLNRISGVDSSDGIVTIITTNDTSKIDPALGVKDSDGKSSRPGRINKIIELGNMDIKCRFELANKILTDCPHEIEKAVAASEGFTPAQVQELFARIALTHYWENKK